MLYTSRFCAYHTAWLKTSQGPSVCMRALIPSSCHPWWAVDCLLLVSSFCLSPCFSLSPTSSLPHCTLTCTLSSMWTAPRETTAATSPNEEYYITPWQNTLLLQKISASLRKCWHPSIEKCSQVLCCNSFCDFVSLFPLLSREGILHFVPSYGHVSLIVDQLDCQCCRSPLFHCCGVVLGSLVSPCETWKLSSDRFTQTSQYWNLRRTWLRISWQRLLDVIGFNGFAVWSATCQWCANLEWRYFDSKHTAALWYLCICQCIQGVWLLHGLWKYVLLLHEFWASMLSLFLDIFVRRKEPKNNMNIFNLGAFRWKVLFHQEMCDKTRYVCPSRTDTQHWLMTLNPCTAVRFASKYPFYILTKT